jgi:hypothetical protein
VGEALDLASKIGNTGSRDPKEAQRPARAMSTVFRLSDFRKRHKRVFFSRGELNQLLSLYSRQVMRGEWRDYAIDQHDGAALFSMFRRSQELPLYTVVKLAPGASRHGDYILLSGRERIATGTTLADVLAQLQRLLGYRPVLLEESRR